MVWREENISQHIKKICRIENVNNILIWIFFEMENGLTCVTLFQGKIQTKSFANTGSDGEGYSLFNGIDHC